MRHAGGAQSRRRLPHRGRGRGLGVRGRRRTGLGVRGRRRTGLGVTAVVGRRRTGLGVRVAGMRRGDGAAGRGRRPAAGPTRRERGTVRRGRPRGTPPRGPRRGRRGHHGRDLGGQPHGEPGAYPGVQRGGPTEELAHRQRQVVGQPGQVGTAPPSPPAAAAWPPPSGRRWPGPGPARARRRCPRSGPRPACRAVEASEEIRPTEPEVSHKSTKNMNSDRTRACRNRAGPPSSRTTRSPIITLPRDRPRESGLHGGGQPDDHQDEQRQREGHGQGLVHPGREHPAEAQHHHQDRQLDGQVDRQRQHPRRQPGHREVEGDGLPGDQVVAVVQGLAHAAPPTAAVVRG